MSTTDRTTSAVLRQADFDADFPQSVREELFASLTPANFEAVLRSVYAKGHLAGARQTEAAVGPLLPRVQITAAMVSALRDKTDAPMMACKKALVEANGDPVRAEDLLRQIGLRFLAGRG